MYCHDASRPLQSSTVAANCRFQFLSEHTTVSLHWSLFCPCYWKCTRKGPFMSPKRAHMMLLAEDCCLNFFFTGENNVNFSPPFINFQFKPFCFHLRAAPAFTRWISARFVTFATVNFITARCSTIIDNRMALWGYWTSNFLALEWFTGRAVGGGGVGWSDEICLWRDPGVDRHRYAI